MSDKEVSIYQRILAEHVQYITKIKYEIDNAKGTYDCTIGKYHLFFVDGRFSYATAIGIKRNYKFGYNAFMDLLKVVHRKLQDIINE